MAASHLPADLAPCLRAVAVAGKEFEPYVAHLLDRSELSDRDARGLIERGPSARPAVGRYGYRLTRRGWDVVALLWYDRLPQAAQPAPRPLIPAG